MVTFDDFLKLDIRVGTIIKVDDFPKAKKAAYKLEIDFGVLGIKKSSAQKQIAGFLSEVLVLGVYSKNGVVLIEPNQHVNNGEKLG